MKIRTGFVSNSSSSSFLLIEGKLENIANLENNKKLILKNYGEEYWNENFPSEFIKRKILGLLSIDYGGEESVQDAINLINAAANTNFELIDLEN